LSKVFRYDIYGRRDSKYEFLRSNSISTIQFERVDVIPPDYFYANKELKHKNVYQKYFQISELFKVGNSGVVSKRVKLNIHFTKDDVVQMISDFNSLKESVLRTKYSIPEDVRDWNFTLAKKDLIDTNSDPSLITQINYRPFDKRYFYYSGKSKGIVGWPVPVVSEHLKYSDNLGLMLNKKIEVGDFAHGLIYRGIVESHAISMKEINYVFPLYLYPANRMSDQLINNEVRVPNLNLEIVSKIAEKISLIYENEKVTKTNTFSPIDILDYIYAILYSPTYRKKYNEYLKIGFPKIPYPKDSKVFLSLAKYGGELRLLHLLESPIVNKFITKYPIKGNNIVCNIKYKNEKVYINETQYFEGISLHNWN
jgi:predicted helicase